MLQKRFVSFFLVLCFWLSAVGFPIGQAHAAAPLQTTTFGKISPGINTNISSSLLMLQWEASSQPGVQYEYCLFTKQNCPSGQWKTAGTNTYATVSLKANTDYFWQVRARSANGGLTYADNNTPWQFSTKPSSFAKSSPTDGAANTQLSVKLTWTASNGINVNYQVCYDTTDNNTCESNIWLSAGTRTEYTLNGLDYATTYHWQVRAYTAKSTIYADGATSSFRSFTTRAAPPTPFVKLNPSSGAESMPLNLSLVWSPSTGTNLTYEYCLLEAAPNGTCGNWVPVGPNTSSAPLNLDYGKVYWWQVRAISGGNTAEAVEANDGTWWTFHTLVVPPSSFTKLLPANGADDVSLTPYLYWSTSEGTGIEYWYCLVEQGQTCDNWVDMGTQTYAKIDVPLENNITYVWQVRAIDVETNEELANEGTLHEFTTLPVKPSWNAEPFTTPEDPLPAYTDTLEATNPGGKSLIYTLAGRQPAGTLLLGANGTFSYTPEADFNGSVTFDFTIWDGVNETAGPYTATITVTAVNDPPQILPITDVSVPCGTDIAFTIETTDADLPYGDTLEISLTGALPQLGTASFTTEYNATTHAASANYEWLGAVWMTSHPGPYQYVLTVKDGAGATASDPFIVRVEPNTIFVPMINR